MKNTRRHAQKKAGVPELLGPPPNPLPSVLMPQFWRPGKRQPFTPLRPQYSVRFLTHLESHLVRMTLDSIT